MRLTLEIQNVTKFTRASAKKILTHSPHNPPIHTPTGEKKTNMVINCHVNSSGRGVIVPYFSLSCFLCLKDDVKKR